MSASDWARIATSGSGVPCAGRAGDLAAARTPDPLGDLLRPSLGQLPSRLGGSLRSHRDRAVAERSGVPAMTWQDYLLHGPAVARR